MFEVHTGSKPGRPTVLLLLAAGVLVVALGLAWVQVQSTRALGEAVSLEGTPLLVRAPEGWVRDAKNPRLFGKPIRKIIWGREISAAERTVEFHYNDFSGQFMRMFKVAAAYPAQPAQIGEWDGVQYVVERNSPRMPGQKVLRWATIPGGGQIGVEYTPLAELSHGDLYLLDEICRAVRVEGAGSAPAPATLPARAGVSFPIAAGWEILGPDVAYGPGFWVQKVEGDRPVWAIGVFRRSLGRADSESFLRLEARRLGWVGQPQGGYREDGALVGVLRHPAPERSGSVVAALWVVTKSSTRAAVIYVLAVPAYAERADDAAEELAGTLEFISDFSG